MSSSLQDQLMKLGVGGLSQSWDKDSKSSKNRGHTHQKETHKRGYSLSPEERQNKIESLLQKSQSLPRRGPMRYYVARKNGIIEAFDLAPDDYNRLVRHELSIIETPDGKLRILERRDVRSLVQLAPELILNQRSSRTK